jgi:hypothetical protein
VYRLVAAPGLALALALGLGLGGCAPLSQSAATTTTNSAAATASQRAKVAIAQATHEYPSTAPRQSAVGGEPSAAVAIRAFATAYINWTSETVSRDMLALALESVGQARSATELASSNTASDYELKRGGIANSGTVEAVAPLPSGSDRYVVVTVERTTASNTDAYEGLAPAWHVTVASATQLSPGRWVVSGWQPEN